MARRLQDLADALAARLGRGVAFDDAGLRLLAHSSQGGPIDEARRESILRRTVAPDVAEWLASLGVDRGEGARYVPGSERMGALGRVCVPLRHDGIVHGYLWIIDEPRSLDQVALRHLEDVAGEAAALLHNEHLVRTAEQRAVARLVDRLLDAPPAERDAAAAALEASVGATGFGVVVIAVLSATASRGTLAMNDRENLLAACERLRISSELTAASVRHDHAAVLLGIGPGGLSRARLRAIAEELVGLVRRSTGGRGDTPLVGVGTRCARLADAPASHRQALVALDVAAAVPEHRPAALYEDLGSYAILAALPREAIGAPDAVGRVERALEPALLATLETYLEVAGDASAAAAALAIHRGRCTTASSASRSG